MELKFREYLAEAEADGTVKFLDHRNVWVAYMHGRIVCTKKTKEAAEQFLKDKHDTKATLATVSDTSTTNKPVIVPVSDTSTTLDDDEPDNGSDEIRTEFDVPSYNLDSLREKIAKLNKTATKLNVAPIVMELGDTWQKEVKHEDGPHYKDGTLRPKKYIEMQRVKITGESPKLNGWSFIGKREPLDGTKSILSKTAPGQKMPKKYADDHDLTCEHCKKRANRAATFVVRKNKKTMEVGRSCLKDFLGHADPAKYAAWAEMLYNLEKSLGGGEEGDNWGMGRAPEVFELQSIMAAALYMCREKGFVSNSNSYGNKSPTSHHINQHFNPPIPLPRGMSYDDFRIPFTDKDKEEATVAIDWLRKHPKAGKDEFFTNLSKIAQGDTASLKHSGYLAAGAMMYQKEQGALKQTVGLMKTLKKDEGLGKADEKIDVLGTVISAFAYQTDWGTKRIFTIKTDSGHLVKMFTMSGDSGIKKESRVQITGRIKEVGPETYEKSPFKDMVTTTMAPRSRIEAVASAEEIDKTFHVGDTVKFRRAGKTDGVGVITAKPVYGKFEISPKAGKAGTALHVSHEDILYKV